MDWRQDGAAVLLFCGTAVKDKTTRKKAERVQVGS